MGIVDRIDRFRLLPKWRRVAIGTIIAVVVFVLASLIPLSQECVPWQYQDAADFYMQNEFSIATLATWYIFIIGGYLYSSIVITAVSEWRTDYRRPFAVLLFGTTMFWLGPVFVLGNASICTEENRQPSYAIETNFLRFGLIQLIAQWFTFLDDVPALNKIMFTADAIKQWTIVQWTIVTGGAGIILGLIGWQLYLLHSIGRLWSYFGALIGIFALFGLVAYCLRHRYYVHFHHYSVGILVAFFPLPNLFNSIVQAIATGICIEGLSRWGPDPFFVPHDKPSPDHIASVLVSNAV